MLFPVPASRLMTLPLTAAERRHHRLTEVHDDAAIRAGGCALFEDTVPFAENDLFSSRDLNLCTPDFFLAERFDAFRELFSNNFICL